MNTTIETTVNDILVNNGLDFQIIKKPMFCQLDENNVVKSDYFGLYNSKSGNVINAVKGSYTVTQNDEIVESVVKGMQGFGELSVHKAGSLNDGKKIFIQLGIEGIGIVGNDTIKRYVTIIDSNDGSTGLSIGIGNLTMSCANQFFHFNKTAQHKFRHTATVTQKVRILHEAISSALKQDFKLMELYRAFESTKVSRDLAHQLVKEIVGIDRTCSMTEISENSTRTVNSMETLYNNIDHEMNSKSETLWGLFSGVTRWTTHEKSSPRRENGRLESMMVGTNYRTNQQALEFCQNQLELV